MIDVKQILDMCFDDVIFVGMKKSEREIDGWSVSAYKVGDVIRIDVKPAGKHPPTMKLGD